MANQHCVTALFAATLNIGFNTGDVIRIKLIIVADLATANHSVYVCGVGRCLDVHRSRIDSRIVAPATTPAVAEIDAGIGPSPTRRADAGGGSWLACFLAASATVLTPTDRAAINSTEMIELREPNIRASFDS